MVASSKGSMHNRIYNTRLQRQHIYNIRQQRSAKVGRGARSVYYYHTGIRRRLWLVRVVNVLQDEIIQMGRNQA